LLKNDINQIKEFEFIGGIQKQELFFWRIAKKVWLLKSKRARHFCRPFVLTNPLNSIAKLQIDTTIKNYFFRC